MATCGWSLEHEACGNRARMGSEAARQLRIFSHVSSRVRTKHLEVKVADLGISKMMSLGMSR